MSYRVDQAYRVGDDGALQTASGTVASNLAASNYVPNPGMGYTRRAESAEYATTMHYLRGDGPGFTWSNLNPAQGVYQWDVIDQGIAAAVALGKKASFRIMTMYGDGAGHRVPAWVIAAGALLHTAAGRDPEPIYHSKMYQQYWGAFVDALAARYDGHPDIAFIDISGYGLYSEWQTYPLTELADENPLNLVSTLDGQAKRRLIHMFVGGSGTALVLGPDGTTEETVAYSHPGFQHTQLVMPYAGQSNPSRFVLVNYPQVGFRNDALGFAPVGDYLGIGYGVDTVWQRAPVMFESVHSSVVPNPDPVLLASVVTALHASILHDADSLYQVAGFEQSVLKSLGYRYRCTLASIPSRVRPGQRVTCAVTIRNDGLSRAYPRMGQDYRVDAALVDDEGSVILSWIAMPELSSLLGGTARTAATTITIPPDAASGDHKLLVSVADRTTGTRINMAQAFGGRGDGWYEVGSTVVAPKNLT